MMDVCLVFIAEVCRAAFEKKVSNHMLRLRDEPVFLMMCELIYE